MKWYVVRSRIEDEEEACAQCRQALAGGIAGDVFVPGYMQAERRRGRWVLVRRTLFPGYFFVETDRPDAVEERLALLARIAEPVCVDRIFTPIRAEEQEFLSGVLDADHVAPMSFGRITDGVCRVYRGPLKGQEHKFRYIDRHKRYCRVEVRMPEGAKLCRIGLEITEKQAG